MRREDLKLATAFAEPENETERRIAYLWANAFDLDRVGVADDFFDLGGDSLIAENIAIAVEATIGVRFKPSQLLEADTPRRMAKLLLPSVGSNVLPSNVVVLNEGGRSNPLFFIHGGAGMTFFRPAFQRALDFDGPIFLFQAPGFDGHESPLGSVEELASSYLDTIRIVQPVGRVDVAAFCAGGWIAVQIARSLQSEGRSFNLILVDPYVPPKLRTAYRISQSPIVRAGIPAVSRIAAAAMEKAVGHGRRLAFFLRTGAYGDSNDPSLFKKSKRVRDYHLRKAHTRHQAIRRRDLLSSSSAEEKYVDVELHTPAHREVLARHYGSDGAVATTALLQLAFRNHKPEPFEGDVAFVSSSSRGRGQDDPSHPLNVLLPNRKLIRLAGRHNEVVRSPETARIIRNIVRPGSQNSHHSGV